MKPIIIRCPVKGRWSFLNPPGHHPDAKDFVAVDENAKPYQGLALLKHLLGRLNVSEVFSWEAPVFAPFDGSIIKVENACEDRQRLSLISDVYSGLFLGKQEYAEDENKFFGNHIIMQSKHGVYALFAHLKKGSVQVKQGDTVKTGNLLASIGNSGNSIQPHLHFHLMKENQPLTSVPLPFVFSAYELQNDTFWRKEKNTLPKNRRVFRVVDGA